ncbi:MAG: hypothetical protein HYZ17_08110 [Betaproteobacteria bacterium]|nr:hypothetical protein [Betaproteobacteria bacterium]
MLQKLWGCPLSSTGGIAEGAEIHFLAHLAAQGVVGAGGLTQELRRVVGHRLFVAVGGGQGVDALDQAAAGVEHLQTAAVQGVGLGDEVADGVVAAPVSEAGGFVEDLIDGGE